MCLVALEDPGLTVFPTHRLVSGLKDDPARIEALTATLREHFEIERIDEHELRPPDGDGPLQLGYIDSHFRQPFRLTLKDQAIADAALADMPEPYRRLDTAILEALLLMGPLGLTEDDISHLHGLGYSRDRRRGAGARARRRVRRRVLPARRPRSSQVREIAAAGVNMPPKSTFFFPKVPTGLLFNPLL